MPIGEVETHPYLHLGEEIPGTRLILGSFPVYECTDIDTPQKQASREQEGTFMFFYGSNRSLFWRLYKTHIDNGLEEPFHREALLNSLTRYSIAISDTIKECQRVGKSSEDTKLQRRVYNRDGIRNLMDNGVTKILCTSKGVMNDLYSKILAPYGNRIAIIDTPASLVLQHQILQMTTGHLPANSKPLAMVYAMNSGSTVQTLSIPSPGSFQRRLKHFGFTEGQSHEYASSYFAGAFNWFME
jgi:G:T/U-mismatch repair DNA glycosylase